MADYTFSPQAAIDIATGELVQGEGMSGQVYASEADAIAEVNPLTVTLAGGVASSDIPVSSQGQSALFIAQQLSVYWRSGGFVVLLVAIKSLLDAAEKAAWSVNGITVDENHNIQVEVAGVDDAGMAELISTPSSATAAALEAIYGPGFLYLDLGEAYPPGTPDGTVILRTAGGGTPPPVPIVYLTDDFERVVAAGSIGAPSGGGSYSFLDIPADWSVNLGAAIWKAPAAGTRGGVFRSDVYSQETVEVLGVVSQDTAAVGNRVVTIRPRRIAAQNDQYGANITLRGPSASRPLQVDLALQKGVTEGDLEGGTAGVLTTGALGEKVRFRVRATQVDPATTRVQARIWLDGTEEPTIWQKDTTDATVTNQGAGSLEVLVRQNSSESVGSEVRIHELTVQSVI